MRCFTVVLSLLFLCMSFVPSCSAAAQGETTTCEAVFVVGSNSYMLNGGAAKKMDVAPYIKEDRVYLPLRYVASALGIKDNDILWDGVNQTITLTKENKVVQLQIGSTSLVLNGTIVAMDVAPEITNNRTMLPIRFVVEAFGGTTEWDPQTYTVTVFSAAPSFSQQTPEPIKQQTPEPIKQQTPEPIKQQTPEPIKQPEVRYGEETTIQQNMQQMLDALLQSVEKYREQNPVYIPFPPGTKTLPYSFPNPSITTSPTHWIKKVLDYGRFIQLEDSSVWEISFIDKIKTSLWLPVDRITIIPSNDIKYPYFLANTRTGEIAKARLIGR